MSIDADVEIIGMIGTQHVSEIHAPTTDTVDPAFVARFAKVHEEAGFDRVLIGHSSSTPDGLQVAAYAAAHTDRLKFLIAHRPGFVAPTVAARALATLDQFSGGRTSVHIISGGSDADQQRDGDFLSKTQRYARSAEFIELLKLVWTSTESFDYSGDHYQVNDVRSEVFPVQQPRIPIYFGGSSADAYRVGGTHADVFALWGEPLAQTKEQIDSVREAASAAGRTDDIGFSVSFRPIIGRTEEEAWERAHRILETIKSTNGHSFTGARYDKNATTNVGSQRLLQAAAAGERHDRALWTATAAASGAKGNSTALVGTPETVAAALLDYVDIGVNALLIRGYDPYDDVIEWGKELIPLVRRGVAARKESALAGAH